MNQPHEEPGRLPAHDRSMRERELEIEVARLEAELEAATGGDATLAASKFLELAATTVDRAVSDARREADALVSELSAEAERRRDDAVRIAAEAEADAARFADLAAESESAAEAARAAAQQVTVTARKELESAREEARRLTDEAHSTARSITEAAQAEAQHQAAQIVETERARIREELDVVTEVRAALERERTAMDQYNDELRQRVQDLAESMVAFMSSDPDFADELADAATPELPSTDPEPVAFEPDAEVFPFETVVESPSASVAFGSSEHVVVSPFGDLAAPLEDPWQDAPAASLFGTDHQDATTDDVDHEDVTLEDVDHEDVTLEDVDHEDVDHEDVDHEDVTLEDADHDDADHQVATLEDADHDDADHEGVDHEDADQPVFETIDEFAPVEMDPDGLFGAATAEEREPTPLSSLFSEHGARLIEQTPPDALADALASDEPAAEEQFQNFFNGDDELDESRDWLLRPETP